LIDSRDDNICLIDLGMSLRVPYSDPYGGGIADVSAGTSRRLMISQGQGGKLMYAAPEVIAKEESVDAFATDMWSVGCVLFVMLVGLAPFKWAHPSDKRYAKMSMGGLKSLIDALEIPLSPEACDLLQGFFWADPRQRLTLAEVMQHPWVQGKEFSRRPATLPNQSSRQFNFGSRDVKKAATHKKFGSLQSQLHPEPKHHHIHLLRPHS
jgi:serine/threonine protein kinase